MIAAIVAAALIASAEPAEVIPTSGAAAVFARANGLCTADGGKLWGVSLCVPIMLADPKTLQAAADKPARGARRDDGIFRLDLPPGTQVANAPFAFAGAHWAQIVWPMFGDSDAQAVTLMHESFHIVQPKLGFKGAEDTASISGDSFLDTQSGRVWVRGELHALRVALVQGGDARRRALQDALTMRLYRHSLSDSTGNLERELDLLEGLAESTGIDAGLPPERRIAYALRDVAFAESQPSYARSLFYATGPAYSELLDAAQAGWRRTVTPSSDVALMAMRAYGLTVTTPSSTQAQSVIVRYGGKDIEDQEAARAARIAQLDAKYERELVDGATLSLPMVNFHIRFDPRDVETLDPYGTVYHTLSVTAPWGTLDVSGGDALISKDFRMLRLAAPNAPKGFLLRGDGWTLRLAPKYRIVSDPERRGSFLVSP